MLDPVEVELKLWAAVWALGFEPEFSGEVSHLSGPAPLFSAVFQEWLAGFGLFGGIKLGLPSFLGGKGGMMSLQ